MRSVYGGNIAVLGLIVVVVASAGSVLGQEPRDRDRAAQAQAIITARTAELLRAHPAASEHNLAERAECINACGRCALACSVCADACLEEDNVDELRDCIRKAAGCAQACGTAASLLAGAGDEQIIRAQVEAAKKASRIAAEEMEKHADEVEVCRLAAEACRQCMQECEKVLQSLPEGRSHDGQHRAHDHQRRATPLEEQIPERS